MESIQNIYKCIGAKPHPQMSEDLIIQNEKVTKNQIANEDQQQNNQPKQEQDKGQYLLFQNRKVDYLAIKILQLIVPFFNNFYALKFVNNDLDEHVITQILQLIQQNNHINKLFFEWNVLDQRLKEVFIPHLANTNLEFLILRSNQVNDNVLKLLCEQIKNNPNCQIKYIELYNNTFTKEGLNYLGLLFESYHKIEYLGLAKNNIKSLDDVKEILTRVGKKILTPEELSHYRDKEKERETLIAKATKQKRKINEDMLPYLEPLLQVAEGQFALFKNGQVKMINLSLNYISEQDNDFLDKFLVNQNEEIQLVLLANNFEPKIKEKLKKKYKKNLQI
ncbi:leucine rich repeat protein [Ichthyophthirius multifiliis]|uniref:Leucine rich repeat protein n=1 Tax=Ichthyophthirius multifiliis TaxID=5932 RepID=G0QXZ7_ICHMU|nr:leucine rich repeat protein [Ichthyophthirius multifiliis]EGR29911.1 leucine rich repeat protein [Ichthyophthirius multifiliis]|eukprot:XP_004031147.1 leucine rich repeat protein [Ichthyophthirius multifiliis]